LARLRNGEGEITALALWLVFHAGVPLAAIAVQLAGRPGCNPSVEGGAAR